MSTSIKNTDVISTKNKKICKISILLTSPSSHKLFFPNSNIIMKVFSVAVLAAIAGSSVEAFTVGTNNQLSHNTFAAVESTTALAGRRRKGKKKFGKVTLDAPKTSSPSRKDITESEVRSLFSLWNNALATGDSRIVAKRYAKESILLPTVSDTPRTDFASIKDYFDAFLLKKPQGEILEGDIRIGDGWCQDAGIYEFTMGGT